MRQRTPFTPDAARVLPLRAAGGHAAKREPQEAVLGMERITRPAVLTTPDGECHDVFANLLVKSSSHLEGFLGILQAADDGFDWKPLRGKKVVLTLDGRPVWVRVIVTLESCAQVEYVEPVT